MVFSPQKSTKLFTFRRLAASILALLLSSSSLAQLPAFGSTSEPQLVGDINRKSDGALFSIPQTAQVIGGYFFFAAKTSEGSGLELWKSDGTANGTQLVKDINPTGSGDPQNLTVVDNTLFFTADDGNVGMELWKSNGTAEGTVRVKDIRPNDLDRNLNAYYDIYGLAAYNGELYFAADDGASGFELWKSDGTASGTEMVMDIYSGTSGSDPSYLTVFDNKLFFQARDATSGTELWTSDGTSLGTELFADIAVGTASSSPSYLTVAGDQLFFSAADTLKGIELWKSDGTAAGTVLVKDINTLTHSNPSGLIASGNSIYFTAERVGPKPLYRQLWKSDGTEAGTVELSNIDRQNGAAPDLITPAGGSVYFVAFEPDGALELWKSQGAEHDASRVTKINNTGASGIAGWSLPGNLAEVNGTLFFTATDGVNGVALWKLDTTGTNAILVEDILPGSENYNAPIYYFFEFAGKLIFTADDGFNGLELWTSDGSDSGTSLITNINNKTFSSVDGEGSPEAIRFKNHIYFAADDGIAGYELWRIDEATGQVALFAEFISGRSGGFPSSFQVVGDWLMFVAYSYDFAEIWRTDGQTLERVKSDFDDISQTQAVGDHFFFSAQSSEGNEGIELWKSDGTEAGTVLVKDINPLGDSYPSNLTSINSMLYFTADDDQGVTRLWKSDGTEAGTVLVKDINQSGQSYPANLTAVGNTLFFTADDGTHDQELWKSDGTEAGTVLVKDINLSGLSNPSNLTAVGDILFFTADDGTGEFELWKSDGTEAGTVLVKDINLSGQSNPSNLTAVGSALFFSADDGVNGQELWTSDGTASGTNLVFDINSNIGASNPGNITKLGNTVYFTANDGSSGQELWKHEGASTTLVKDLLPGITGSSPVSLIVADEALFFLADNGQVGFEWWRLGAAIEQNQSGQNQASGGDNNSSSVVIPVILPEDTEAKPPTPQIPTNPAPMQIRHTINNFRGNSAILTSTLRQRIASATKANSAAVRLVCTGFTSGVKASNFSKRLAAQRAENVCKQAQMINPNLSTYILLKPAAGVGPQFRKVEMKFAYQTAE